MSTDDLIVTDAGIDLRPDSNRTILRLFVPGHEDVGAGDSRAGPVINRILALTETQVEESLRTVIDRFTGRHPQIAAVWETHAEMVSHRLDNGAPSAARRQLLGAAFTHEYSIEGAALCNPSIVRHPRQPATGATAFVMSVRGIGEGHRSSIGLRTGSVQADGAVGLDPIGPSPVIGTLLPGIHRRALLHRKLAELGDDRENAAYVLDQLPELFGDTLLAERLAALAVDARTRRHTESTIRNLRRLASCSYRVEFPATAAISERVLWPRSPIERHGMEDARFVEITDGSAPRYCATYTAYDGTTVSQNLLTTEDFSKFEISPLAGDAAQGKGLALFPRRVGGRYAALSRSDRETNSIAFSDDLRCWDSSELIQVPQAAWEIIQLGNCGSPIETDQGWLVITHGVGPMRTYSLGAILLDLHEPEHVIGSTTAPIITPPHHGGYVPNVVYSCGSMAVDGRLILPYGIGDQTIAIATLDIDRLIASMRRHDTT